MGINAPIKVSTNTEINIAPVTFLINSTMVSKMPATASMVAGSDRSPIVKNVAGWSTTMPAFFKPIKAMNNPIPHCTPILSAAGIASAILVRTPVTDNSKNRIPFQNTIPSAASQ